MTPCPASLYRRLASPDAAAVPVSAHPGPATPAPPTAPSRPPRTAVTTTPDGGDHETDPASALLAIYTAIWTGTSPAVR